MIRKYLGKALDALFAEFTGVHFHIAWTPALPRRWDVRTLPTGCSVCCRLTGSLLLPDCRICGPKQLARALNAGDDGHRFTCRLGVRNYWLAIRVRTETLGIAYLQAPEHSTARRPGRNRSARAAQVRPLRSGAKALSRLEFARAARFLQHIVRHVQTSSLADLRKADLTRTRRALSEFEKVQARMRKELNRLIPAFHQTPPVSESSDHTERLVHCLLERVHQDYAKPIMLRQSADSLGLNAGYLSALFSRAVGLPFRTYLTEVRVEKARELLSDPAKAVSEVAYAVGYASENRFRVAFKKVTGLPPRIWRETLRMPQGAC